jgi:hypothetical protein
MLDASAYLSENRLGFLPVSMIITEPAVGEGPGLAGIFFHKKGFIGYPSINMDFYTLGGVELPVPVELNIEGPACQTS